MKVVANNTEILRTKILMTNLLICAKDKSLPIAERNYYYSEYLQASASFLNQSK